MTSLYRAGLVLLLLCFVHTLSATTFYVRTDGNDNNDGLADNASRALRTIQKGVDKMRGGDVLVVGNGTYSVSGLIYIDGKSGTSSRRTVIKSKNRWGAKIRTSNLYGGVQIRNSNYITVDGFDIGHSSPNNASLNQGTGLESFDSDYVVFQNNYVHDCGCGGISFREGDYATIQNNVTRDNAKNSPYNCSGISVYQPEQLNNNSGFHIIIRRNVSFENECTLPFNIEGLADFDKPTDGNGIILDDYNNTQRSGYAPYKAKTLVENNLVFNNGGAGIKVYEVDNATIRHNTAWHNNRILKDYSGTPGDIAVTYSPGIFEVYNNVSVSLNNSACSALEYINTPGVGYMNRQSNLLVGNVKMPSDNSKWGASNDLTRGRGEQSYAGLVNPTTSIGSFGSVKNFDQYFRLTGSSPGNNSGNNSYKASNDLEGDTRPQNGTVERGCYEGTSGGNSGTPITTNSNDYVYRESLNSGWANWSWNGTVTIKDGGIKKNGSFSAKFQSGNNNAALSFHHSSGKTGSNLSSIKFYARKWTDNPSYTSRFRVRTESENGTKGWINFNPGNNFVEYTFTKAQLGNPGTVRRIEWNVPNNRTLWVDDVRLVYTTTSQNTVTQELADNPTPAAVPLADEMRVFPNPNSGRFTLQVQSEVELPEVTLRLYDLRGRVVDELKVGLQRGNNTLRYDLRQSQIPTGVYLLRAASTTGFDLQQRVIID